MKFKKYIFLSLSALIVTAFNNNIQPDLYHKVKILTHNKFDVERLNNLGIDLDHYIGHITEGITVDVSDRELHTLQQNGIPYEMLNEDVSKFYEEQLAADIDAASYQFETDGVDGFRLGAMGGYYTYAEVVQQLDSMRLLYPNIISVKQSLGNSTESRAIWMVKISDNPGTNESSSEAQVYYDALHHAREPMSMEALMYYMWWLLENYGTNAEATYIINNREIFFVPVVNPDGYVYNQTTNPNGGGGWRKNRRNNGGSFGVDLNRNYPFGWGLNSGSSSDPASETYRGPSAGSEPETQAIMNFVNSIDPKIAFSTHSVAGRYLNPYGYNDSAVAFDVYADLSGEFAQANNYTYGTVIEMLDYYSSGTTRDWLHSTGTYAWTPEVGRNSFWDPPSLIIPVCQENLQPLKYLTWVSGSYARMQAFKIVTPEWAAPGDTLKLQVTVRNKGLSRTSKNVSVTLTTSYPNVSAITSTVAYDSIQARQRKVNTNLFKFRINNGAVIGDEIKFLCTVSQEGVVSSVDTIKCYVGRQFHIFLDESEGGTNNWTKAGNQIQWDTTYIAQWLGNKSITDSRYGNSNNSTNNTLTLNSTISLVGRVNPRVQFAAKWATEVNFDYVRFQISTNNGTSWTNLAGKYTTTVSGQPSYTAIRHWVYEQINLNAYIGQNVRFRFNYITDAGVPGDGFYFDNFQIVDYRDTLSGIIQSGTEIPVRFSLSQNYPNPFNPATNIKFDIPVNAAGQINLMVYNTAGQLAAMLVNEQLNAGSYTVSFDGSTLSSGIYYYRIQAGQYSDVKKMILVK